VARNVRPLHTRFIPYTKLKRQKKRTLTKSTPGSYEIDILTHCSNKGDPTNTMNRQPQYNRFSDYSTLPTYPIYQGQPQSVGDPAVCAELCSSDKYAGAYAKNSGMLLHTLVHFRNGEVVRLERQEPAISNLSKGHEENSVSISNDGVAPQMKR
jgi:hypothetical protein